MLLVLQKPKSKMKNYHKNTLLVVICVLVTVEQGFILGCSAFLVRGPSPAVSGHHSILSLSKGEENSVPRRALSTKPLFLEGPPLETKPNYDEIHGPLGPQIDNLFLSIFRTKFSQQIEGMDSQLPNTDYQGLMELTAALNARYSSRETAQRIAQNVLRSLFPSWLPPQFAIMFAKPFPEFSARMNAWATVVMGTWLMGECDVNDVEYSDGSVGKNQGVLVKRCRFLEESNCASVCVNTCKIPTQNFFQQEMGLPLTMTPDYETGECQFSFGLVPEEKGEALVKDVPCLKRCPSAGGMRSWHDSSQETRDQENDREGNARSVSSQCHLMEKEQFETM
jgi:hypothetical protein